MINLERYGDAPALVGRLFFSSMFLAFSYGKLTAFGGTSGYMTSLGLVALGLAIFVLASAFIGHSQLGDSNQFMHFMKNMAIVGGSLAFVAFGAGAYSLDARTVASTRHRAA